MTSMSPSTLSTGQVKGLRIWMLIVGTKNNRNENKKKNKLMKNDISFLRRKIWIHDHGRLEHVREMEKAERLLYVHKNCRKLHFRHREKESGKPQQYIKERKGVAEEMQRRKPADFLRRHTSNVRCNSISGNWILWATVASELGNNISVAPLLIPSVKSPSAKRAKVATSSV